MNLAKMFRLCMLVLASLCVTPAVAQPVAPAAVPVAADPSPGALTDGYVLGAGDVIEVGVLGREDFRSRVQVLVDGSITLPLIGNVSATNKTILQLKSEIQDKLRGGGYFSNPAVSIWVVTYASRYVVVLGEVGSPGIVPIDRAYRISEILARVGGAKASGADELTITRVSGEEVKLDLKQIATDTNQSDPFVNAGDKIFVPVAPSFYVYGEVHAPGNYRIDTGMTIRMAIARSGGLTPLGSQNKLKVNRNGREYRLRLDDQIRDKDVIVVGQRFF
ncbi:MAG: polysaccharide biosynthesis/export family protein [Pseudomonadota bacterium]